MAMNDLPILSALRTKMQWHQERQRVLAENISNSDTPNFRPRGAREVRRAAQAFIEMKARVERSIEQRTAMLAGVSHDLRTILTRFKLELALIGEGPEIDAMRKDVDEMSAMLEAYLAFARGDSGENAQPTDMAARSTASWKRSGSAALARPSSALARTCTGMSTQYKIW